MTRRSLEFDFRLWTDAMLQVVWERGFEDRVKTGRNKGQIKMRAIKFGDAVLTEAERRGVRLQTPAKYQ